MVEYTNMWSSTPSQLGETKRDAHPGQGLQGKRKVAERRQEWALSGGRSPRGHGENWLRQGNPGIYTAVESFAGDACVAPTEPDADFAFALGRA